MAARRDPKDAPNGIGLHPNWAWVWPMNRRILYNRASVNRQRRAVQPAQVGHPLERGEEDVGRRRSRRRHAAGRDRIPSSCWPRASASSSRRTWWTGRFPSTTSRWRARSGTCLSKTQSSPCAQVWQSSGVRPVRHARRLPHRRHDLPRVRALADRRHEPQHAVARRASRPHAFVEIGTRAGPARRASRTATG